MKWQTLLRRLELGRHCAEAVFALLTGATCVVYAAPVDTPGNAPAGGRISIDLAMIHEGERRGLTPLQMGRVWAKLASDYQDAMEFRKSEDAYNHALHLIEASSQQGVDYAVVLSNLGSLYYTMGNNDAAERCVKRMLAIRERLGDSLETARGKSRLATVHLAMRKFKEARREALEAYREMDSRTDAGSDDLVTTLFTLAYATCTRDGCTDSMSYAQRAWSLASGSYPADSTPVGLAHMALGYAEWRANINDNPDAEMRKGVEILKTQLPSDHPYLIDALEQYRAYLKDRHREPESSEIAQQIARLGNVRQGSCRDCTVSVYGLRGQ